MTAREVVELIRKNLGVNWNERSARDTFKIGDPDATVTGVATAMTVTFNVLRKAAGAKLNMIVTHEGTFWNDADDTKELADNRFYRMKTEFCRQNGIVIWRLHDHQHARRPDQVIVASLRSIGIEDEDAYMGSNRVYTVPETTLGALASLIKKRTGSRAFRVVGDPNAKVSRIALGVGYATPRITPEADVVISGESQESDGMFDNASYVNDAAALGIPKGLIMLGHHVSEQPGMEEFARWLRKFVPEAPVQFISEDEPYWT